MRKMLFVSVVSATLVILMAAPALAHVCFVADKPDGAGSAGSATVFVDVAFGPGGELIILDDVFIPGSDLKFNPNSGRVEGGFVTLTVNVSVWELDEEGNPTEVAKTLSQTEDVIFQATVGGGAHFAGPGDSGCDGVGVDSLADCLIGAATH